MHAGRVRRVPVRAGRTNTRDNVRGDGGADGSRSEPYLLWREDKGGEEAERADLCYGPFTTWGCSRFLYSTHSILSDLIFRR